MMVAWKNKKFMSNIEDDVGKLSYRLISNRIIFKWQQLRIKSFFLQITLNCKLTSSSEPFFEKKEQKF
jgi:hypothetical protein